MSLWLGNRTRIAAHYDLPDNLAVVAAGWPLLTGHKNPRCTGTAVCAYWLDA